MKLLLLVSLVLLGELLVDSVFPLFQILGHLNKRRSIDLMEPQHCFQNITKGTVIAVLLLQSLNTSSNQFLSVKLMTFLVETSNVFHSRQLEKEQAHAEDVTFVHIMLCKP
jgi:hypothetical protein